jgi:putative aldouronate transport system substrate-binding protein
LTYYEWCGYAFTVTAVKRNVLTGRVEQNAGVGVREKRTIMVLLLGVVLAAALLAGASRIARGRVLARASQLSFRVSPDAVDDPGQRLEITWMTAPYTPSARNGTWIQRRLEEAFNIDINPVFLGYGQKKELFFAGGDIPDVCWEGDPISVQRLAYHGFIAEVPYELILKHAPDYVALINREAPATWLYSYWDGRNWGLPTLWLNGARIGMGAWRQDWLERVGIEKVPETLDEFHEALRRFVTDDPNGSGVADTYGMMGQIEWWRCYTEIFGAFGIGPFAWTERDGQAVWSGILPEARQALGVLRQWYAEGIIHPDFVSAVPGASEQKFLNGQIGYLSDGVGSVRALDKTKPRSLVSQLQLLSGPGAEVVAGPPPRGPAGEQGAWCWGGGGNVIVFGRPTVDSPEKVVRLLKLFNELVVNEELFVESKIGKRGLHWDLMDPAVGKSSGIRILPPYDIPHRAKREALMGSDNLGGGWVFSPNCGDPAIYNKYREPHELAFIRDNRLVELRIRDIFMKPDVVPSAGLLFADLRVFQETVYAEIIRGEKPLDYFDTFVAEWNRRGGDVLTREANELLKIRSEIYRKVGVDEGDAE